MPICTTILALLDFLNIILLALFLAAAIHMGLLMPMFLLPFQPDLRFPVIGQASHPLLGIKMAPMLIGTRGMNLPIPSASVTSVRMVWVIATLLNLMAT